MLKHLTTLMVALLALAIAQAQERQPVYQLSKSRPNIKAFTHATIVASSTQTYEDATLLIEDDIIMAIGKDISIPPGTEVIDLKGYWIYPGLIDPYALYGQKVERSRSRGPQFETKRQGPYHWNEAIKTHESLNEGFNPSSKENEALRKLGFTTAHLAARDGIFRAQGLVLHLGEPDPHSAILSENASLGVSFNKGSSTQDYPNSLMGAVALIRQTILDAQWYERAAAAYRKNPKQTAYDQNLSLQAWNETLEQGRPVIFETSNFNQSMLALDISQENDLLFVWKSAGDEYRNIEAIKEIIGSYIVPLNFPEAYKIDDLSDAREISMERLRAWELAPSNPARLANANISFALTTDGLKNLKDFYPNLRKAMARGLTEEQALAALTSIPAQILGLEDKIGSLGKGMMADFVISSGNLFSADNKIHEVYVAGQQFENEARPTANMLGHWAWDLGEQQMHLALSGNATSPKAEVYIGKTKKPTPATFKVDGKQFQLQFSEDEQYYSMRGVFDGERLTGYAQAPSGERSYFEATPAKPKKSKTQTKSAKSKEGPQIGILANSQVPFPLNGYGRLSLPQAEDFVVRNATLWTNTDQGILVADVWVEGGKIKAVGQELSVPQGVKSIDGTGKHLTTGIIDEHSHASITQGTNEGTHSVSAEVRVRDAINPGAINLYRHLAGGTTTSQLLHGSANPIGGQSAIVKLKWGNQLEGLLLDNQPGFIKFALGENVKRSNRSSNYTVRYPQTRMG
ncbi:MAG: amidohydrolase family protein, partial [Bacteroidota bacterium]